MFPTLLAEIQRFVPSSKLQTLQGTYNRFKVNWWGMLISIGCANIIAITERNLENWSLAGGHLRMENGGREMSSCACLFLYIEKVSVCFLCK